MPLPVKEVAVLRIYIGKNTLTKAARMVVTADEADT
jgi:hypothetical protein